MTARLAQLGASRYDHLHGDEDDAPELTPADQRQIAIRADELFRERRSDDKQFAEIIHGCDYFTRQLDRIERNFDNACSGDQIGRNAVMQACSQIVMLIRAEMETAWRADCERQAERELVGEAD